MLGFELCQLLGCRLGISLLLCNEHKDLCEIVQLVATRDVEFD